MSPQERLVRETYQKLAAFSRAALLDNAGSVKEPPDPGGALQFELADFRVGPIGEIRRTLNRDLVTLPFGEIITIGRRVTQHNKGEEFVSYTARWTTGQYASAYDRQWTVGDLLDLEPNKYYDVGEYASYEVTVSFKGKSRTYRALALFHNPHGSVESLKPEVWDAVVGMGGALTDVWYERRRPFGQKGGPTSGTRRTSDEGVAFTSADSGAPEALQTEEGGGGWDDGGGSTGLRERVRQPTKCRKRATRMATSSATAQRFGMWAGRGSAAGPGT